MKHIIIFIAIYIFAGTAIGLAEQDKFWSENAETIAKGTFKYSLFSKGEYGISESMSLELHPIMIFLSPSLDLKYIISKKDKMTISVYHGLNCPTPLMNLLARKGTGGIISRDYDIPLMLSIRNGIIVSHKCTDKLNASARLGFEFALNNGALLPGSSVDLPVILPRMAVYYKNAGFNFLLNTQYNFNDHFDFFVSEEMFAFPFGASKYDNEYSDGNASFFNELSGSVNWKINKTASLGIGACLSYGNYPFGSMWHLLPTIDFVKYIE